MLTSLTASVSIHWIWRENFCSISAFHLFLYILFLFFQIEKIGTDRQVFTQQIQNKGERRESQWMHATFLFFSFKSLTVPIESSLPLFFSSRWWLTRKSRSFSLSFLILEKHGEERKGNPKKCIERERDVENRGTSSESKSRFLPTNSCNAIRPVFPSCVSWVSAERERIFHKMWCLRRRRKRDSNFFPPYSSYDL